MADDPNKSGDGDDGGKADVDARIAAQVKAMLADKTAEAVVEKLLRDAHSARDGRRAAEAKLPPAGSVVLSADEAKDWEGYRGLGRLDDLKKTAKEYPTLKADNDGYRRKETIADVAENTYPGKAKTLAKILPTDAVFETRDEKDKGKDVKVVYLKGADGKDEKLVDFIAREHSDLLPALTGSATNAAFRPNTTPAPRTLGTQAPPSGKSEEDLIYEETAARGGYSRM